MVGRAVFLLILIALSCSQDFRAQTTAFNYQGKLTDGGNPASGAFQMQFKLFDSLGGAGQVGTTITDVPVTVSQGIFSSKLDFGANALSGANRWLEIAVRRNSGESYVTLSPREQIASSPYAVRTLSASTADNALSLGGIAANQYVQTNDPRLTDARPPSAGSANYIQNSTTQQPSSNFNITGDGTVGGTLKVTGNVGLGLNFPDHKLHVNGIAAFGAAGGVYSYKLGEHATVGFNNYWNGTGYAAGTSGLGGLLQYSFLNGELTYATASSRAAGELFSFTPRISVLPSGRMGLGDFGSFVPTARLHVWTQADSVAILAVASGANRAIEAVAQNGTALDARSTNGNTLVARSDFGFAGHFTGRVFISNSVGIGTEAPQRLLHVSGRARIGSIPLEPSAAAVCFDALGDLIQCGASSLKWKTNVRPFSLGLDVVKRLRPISFRWKENGSWDYGLAAEDVAAIAPELSFTNAKGEVEGVKYDRLGVILINAIQEHQALIERQQGQIDKLRRLLCRRSPRLRICRGS